MALRTVRAIVLTMLLLVVVPPIAHAFCYSLGGGAAWKEFDPSTTPITASAEPVLAAMTEDVTIFENGSCELSILMNVPSSPLSQIFRDFLGFPGDIHESNKMDINETVTFIDTIKVGQVEYNDSLTIGPVDHNEINVTAAETRARDEFFNGIIEEHRHSFGIIMDKTNMTAKMWGIDDACLVEVNATALCVGALALPGEVFIGPVDLNASFARAGFVLTKIGYAQQMLGSFACQQIYDSTWKTTFFLPHNLTNQEELANKTWYQDFGNGTTLEADLTLVTLQEVVLTERMLVTEETISVTPEELLEDRFLCYKAFHMENETGGGQATSSPPSTCSGIKDVGGINNGFDPSWSLKILDEEFSLPIKDGTIVDVTLHVHPKLELSGCVSWDFEWFKLKKFAAYTQLDATIDVALEVFFGIDETWSLEKTLIERSRRKVFMAGCVPVEVCLKFTTTARLKFEVKAGINVTFPAKAEGFMKAGVGWKRKKGWYPILGTGMDVNISEPDIRQEKKVTITPSVGFRLSLIFYETAGPFIELEPYAALSIHPDNKPDWLWRVELGINVNAGIEFSDWLKAIFDLDDWSWTLYNYVFWECWTCKIVDEDFNVAVIDVRANKTAFVSEPVPVEVDVLNIGKEEVNVNVTLYYREEDIGPWIQIGLPKTVNNLKRAKSNTTAFVWPTSGLEWNPANYAINATATVLPPNADGNTTDNTLNTTIRLEVRNVRIVDVTTNTDWVFEGQSVRIDVTVENNGSVPVSALPVFAYYDGKPISDIWCEYTRMVFDLPAGDSEVLTFKWDTTDVPSDTYTINAIAALLLYERNETDNTMEDGPVTVIGPPPQDYNANIAVTAVVPYEPAVLKGDTVDINVTVANLGNHSETFYVTAYANRPIIQTKVVTLSNGTITNVTFTWNTAGREAKGEYIISAYVPPLPRENYTADNTMVADSRVNVLILGHDVAIKDVSPSKTVVGQGYNYSINVTAKNYGTFTENFNVTTYYTATIFYDDFECGQKPQWTYCADNPNISAVTEINDDIHKETPTHSLYIRNLYGDYKGQDNGVAYAELNITQSPPTIPYTIEFWFYPNQSTYIPYYNSWEILHADQDVHLMLHDDPDGTIRIIDDISNRSLLYPSFEFQSWHKISYTRTGANNYILQIDNYTWPGDPYGDSLSDVSTLLSFGDNNTDFAKGEAYWDDILIFINSRITETKTVTNLPAGNETTITFTWDTTGVPYGNYTISIKATGIPDETNPTDNTFDAGKIVVTIPGDVDGNGYVNFWDFIDFAGPFGTEKGQQFYDPNCDINGDDSINFDDFIIFSGKYGQSIYD